MMMGTGWDWETVVTAIMLEIQDKIIKDLTWALLIKNRIKLKRLQSFEFPPRKGSQILHHLLRIQFSKTRNWLLIWDSSCVCVGGAGLLVRRRPWLDVGELVIELSLQLQVLGRSSLQGLMVSHPNLAQGPVHLVFGLRAKCPIPGRPWMKNHPWDAWGWHLEISPQAHPANYASPILPATLPASSLGRAGPSW